MRRYARLLALGLALGCLSSGVLAVGNVCSTADVGQAFRLPDGTLHPAGTLTLCVGGEHSPVSFRHATYVDRMPVGVFTSKLQVLETRPDANRYMVFAREGKGVLRLSGLAIPRHDRVELYRMDTRARVEIEDSIQFVASDEAQRRLPGIAVEDP